MHGVQQHDQGLVGPAAARLPWLCPPADALIQLASATLPVASLSNDVGLVLLALRYARSAATPDTFRFSSLRESVVAEAASRLLVTHTPFWLAANHPVARQLHIFSERLSAVAGELADGCETVSVEAAKAVGLIAPVGLWAAATVDADAVSTVLHTAGAGDDSLAHQRQRWGLSHEEIARRLCARWRLPEWVRATIATLSHSHGDAVRLGADFDLSRILRDAVARVEAEGTFVGWLSRSTNPAKVVVPMDVAFHRESAEEDPRTLRLLPQLLRTVAQARRAGNEPRLRAAEDEVARLHVLLADVRDSFEIAVRDAKLSGLAELAAGAGHEINNPLAVISGNAQRLRKNEPDADRQKALDTIVRQSTRISDIVRELMQFARPARPNRGDVDVTELAGTVVGALQPQASVKGVELRFGANGPSHCAVDFAQTRRALEALVQNAIEATPSGGCIRVAVEHDARQTRLLVEDNGAGPSDEAVPHLFDPFYSGRPAGRGRGLGLATAWRLVSINGGDLQFQRLAGGYTQFVMIFPTAEKSGPALRIPA